MHVHFYKFLLVYFSGVFFLTAVTAHYNRGKINYKNDEDKKLALLKKMYKAYTALKVRF